MKKFFKPVGLVMFVALAISLFSSTAEAQRLSRLERVVVGFLADGTLSASELTRSQQRRLVPSSVEGLRADLEVLELQIDMLFDEIVSAFDNNDFGALDGLFAELDELNAAADAVLEQITFQFSEILFESPRRRRNAFNNRQLIRRARRRETGAAFNTARAALPPGVFPFILGSDSALDAALIIAFDEVGFSPDAFINTPGAIGSLVDTLESVLAVDMQVNENENSVLSGVDLRLVAADAIVAFVEFIDEEFGL